MRKAQWRPLFDRSAQPICSSQTRKAVDYIISDCGSTQRKHPFAVSRRVMYIGEAFRLQMTEFAQERRATRPALEVA